MTIDKSLLAGSTSLLLLKLLETGDLYGYQMIRQLRLRSDDTFALKAGTLYPILHTLEAEGALTSYDRADGGRLRRYYSITDGGRALLAERTAVWRAFSGAVDRVLEGGASCARA